MKSIRSHEDLVAWRVCCDLDAVVFRLTAEGPASRDFRYRDQIRGSAGSAAPNIAEGFGRFKPGDCAKFLRVAIGSLMETATHLELGRNRGYFTPERHADADRLCRLALRLTRAFLASKIDQIAAEKADREARKKVPRPRSV